MFFLSEARAPAFSFREGLSVVKSKEEVVVTLAAHNVWWYSVSLDV